MFISVYTLTCTWSRNTWRWWGGLSFFTAPLHGRSSICPNIFTPIRLFPPVFPLFSPPHPKWSPIILTPSLSFSPNILIPLPFNVPCYCHPFSHYLLLPSPQSPYCQGCAVRKTEGSPVLKTCKIQGTQHVISMKKVRFFSSLRAKVRRYRPLGAARVQPC